MLETPITRRDFLKGAAALTAAAMLPTWFVERLLAAPDATKPTSPNDRPGIALIGCGGRGMGIVKEAAKFGDVVAVCDVDDGHADAAVKAFDGAKPYKDFRKLLERNDVQVILNATPDHWHTLINLAAVKAGKDVYGEKPLTLTIDEGKRLVAAVKESKRILQVGSQQRSDPRFRLACELVRNGRLGELKEVTAILPAGPNRGGFEKKPVPDGFDWDFWQGQAPEHDYMPERTHLWFRYWLDYSGGTMTDWGAHHNDIARWGIGLDGPRTVVGKATVDPVPGGFTAPAEYAVEYTWANGVRHRCVSTTADTIFGTEARPLKEGERRNGVLFEGKDGWIWVTRGKIEASRPEILSEPLRDKKVALYESNDHMGNFFECVRSRKAPVADVETGHRSVSVCHLGVIALRLGRKLTWDPDKETFADDKEADGYLAREMRKPWTYDLVK